MAARKAEGKDVYKVLVDADDRPRNFGPESSASQRPAGYQSHAPSATAPAAFIGGALLTVCVLFLAGGSMGIRWQGATGGSGVQNGLLPRKGGAHAVIQASEVAPCPTAAAEQEQRKCPKPQACEECAEPEKCPEPEVCPDCKACPAPKPCPGASAAPAPHRLRMPWTPLLTKQEVLRGMGYYGGGEAIQRVVAKLLAGEPITVYTLGGSVTKGSGSSAPEASYPLRFFEFINATFPHRDHIFQNKGVGGTSSGIFSACAEQMVPNGADLIIIEFTVNELGDVPFTDPQRRGYEQLIRKLLRMQGSPALILLHHYCWWKSFGDGVDRGLYYQPMAESQLYTLSQYYNIPSVSLKSAVYPLMRNGVDGFKPDKLWAAHKENVSPMGVIIPGAEKSERPSYFYYDRTHPNDRGHQVLAELLSSVLLRAAEDLQTEDANPAGWAEPRGIEALASIPAPMIPGNADAPTTLCAMQEDFKPIVVKAKGFEYRAERPKEDTFVSQKWGWTATEPGAWAELEFDSRSDSVSDVASAVRAQVYLSHLKSYENMGTAEVECMSGCDCFGKMVMDGTWDLPATLMQIHKFEVSQHRECRVRVTVREQAGEFKQKKQGHKVTLMAIMVSHFPLRLSNTEGQAEAVADQVSGA